jgi:hypothetical protein
LGIASRWLLTASRASVAELCAPGSPTVDLADDVPGSAHSSARMPGGFANRLPHSH